MNEKESDSNTKYRIIADIAATCSCVSVNPSLRHVDMTIIMFVFASGMYFYCVNENVSLVLSAATPCCVKRGELQYICKQNSKPCYHIFYVQQTQDFGASIRLCCRMISVHTKYSEI